VQPPLPEPPSPREAPPEPKREKERERHPVLALSVALVGIAAMVLVALALTRPVPCSDRDFLSDRFGYCASTPQAWEEGDQTTTADRFVLGEAAATLEVTATRVGGSTDNSSYVEEIRSLDEEAGFAVGDVKRTEIDGEPAAYFDAGGTSADAEFAVREVVVVRDGVAWRITFTDLRDSFDEHFGALGEFLGSWQFN
jgi:hypothetical protein